MRFELEALPEDLAKHRNFAGLILAVAGVVGPVCAAAGLGNLEGKYLTGPPQLVVEVAASSASYDLHDKLEAYRLAGVQEYVVWRVLDAMIDWFQLRDGEYSWTEPDDRGVIESARFAGLRLDVPKLLAGDLAGVLDELNPRTGRGGATP